MIETIKLIRFHGDTFVLPITLSDPNNNAVDLTGVLIKFTLKGNVEIKENAQGVSVDREDIKGKFIITIPAPIMEKLSPNKMYPMAIQVIYPDGKKETLFLIELSIQGI